MGTKDWLVVMVFWLVVLDGVLVTVATKEPSSPSHPIQLFSLTEIFIHFPFCQYNYMCILSPAQLLGKLTLEKLHHMKCLS